MHRRPEGRNLSKKKIAFPPGSDPDRAEVDLLRLPGIDRLPREKRRKRCRDAADEIRLFAPHKRQEFLGEPLLLGKPPPLPRPTSGLSF